MSIYQRIIKYTFIPLIALLCLTIVPQAQAKKAVDTITPGVLTVGIDLTYPPYEYLDKDKNAAGSDPEFMRMLAKHMNLKPKFEDTRFSQLIIGLRSDHFDVVASNLYITAKRAKVIDYVPYYQTGDSLVVLSNGDFKPKEPKDLCGKKVSSIKGASWIPKLNKVTKNYCLPNGKPKIKVREFSTAPEASQALLSHGVDVQFADALVAKQAVEKTGGSLEITSDELLFPIPVGLGVSKGNDEMKAAIKSAIQDMKDSGEYRKWLDKYNLDEPNEAQVKKALSQG